VLTRDAIFTVVIVGRRYNDRTRFGDSWVTPSQLAPDIVDARCYASPWKRPSLGVLASLRNSKFPRELSGCIHAYFMKRVGLVPMAAAGELVATSSADGQHSADDQGNDAEQPDDREPGYEADD
jgi:hypothetical protein